MSHTERLLDTVIPSRLQAMPGRPGLRIGIVVVAYNAESTLVRTLDRIPQDFRERIAEIIICDDASSDATFDLGRQWALKAETPKTYVIRHTKNLGYGGNQKAAYSVAVRHDLDVVVMLHGDGQYAPRAFQRSWPPSTMASPTLFSDPGCWIRARLAEAGCRYTSVGAIGS